MSGTEEASVSTMPEVKYKAMANVADVQISRR